MSPFLRRYEIDVTRPTLRQIRTDLLRRIVLPAAGVWAVIVAVGLLIVGPLEALPAEAEVNEALVEDRTPLLNTLTSVWSNIGATLFIIASCAVGTYVLWRRTRQWWLAVVPAIAVSVQAGVFVASAVLVARERPDVEHLDDSPPTSSFPSGHVGASTAFYVTLALLAQRLKRPLLRWGATTLCLLVPLLVAYARLYRGMHYLSDVVVGLANGLACSWLAWRYVRREPEQEPERRAERRVEDPNG